MKFKSLPIASSSWRVQMLPHVDLNADNKYHDRIYYCRRLCCLPNVTLQSKIDESISIQKNRNHHHLTVDRKWLNGTTETWISAFNSKMKNIGCTCSSGRKRKGCWQTYVPIASCNDSIFLGLSGSDNSSSRHMVIYHLERIARGLHRYLRTWAPSTRPFDLCAAVSVDPEDMTNASITGTLIPR